MNKKNTEIRYLLNHVMVIAAMPDNNFNTVHTAHALGTTQPNVSKKITQFELVLGVDVFTRDQYGHYTGLTPEGKEVYEHCVVVVSAINKIVGASKC